MVMVNSARLNVVGFGEVYFASINDNALDVEARTSLCSYHGAAIMKLYWCWVWSSCNV